MGLTVEMLEDLVRLGDQRREYVPPSLENEEVAWDALVGREQWLEVMRTWPATRLGSLIRGLVLYSRASRRSIGGSGSPVIWLYDAFVAKAPNDEPELTRWILAHRTNSWEPFGTMNDYGATTYAEYRARALARSATARANEALEADRQRDVARVRGQRATQRLAAAVRRGDLSAVQALVAAGADLRRAVPEGTSLIGLAVENGRDAVADWLRSIGST